MKLLICIKAVLGKVLNENSREKEKYVINPYDFFALCQTIKMKNDHTEITCLCMGPIGAKEVLYKCLALGCDHAILLCDSAFAGSDTYATSYILYQAIQKIDHDFIVCGDRSIDGETGQVAYNLAARKNYLCISDISEFISNKYGKIKLETNSSTRKNVIKIAPPAILVCNNWIQETSVSLFALKKAKKNPITIWGKTDINCEVTDIGQTGSKTKVIGTQNIRSKRSSIIIDKIENDEVAYVLFNEIKKIV